MKTYLLLYETFCDFECHFSNTLKKSILLSALGFCIYVIFVSSLQKDPLCIYQNQMQHLINFLKIVVKYRLKNDIRNQNDCSKEFLFKNWILLLRTE